MSKIQPHHLTRTAYIYIRQSTRTQVQHNVESQRLQYGLQERARALGWQTIHTIDEDLGRSGSGQVARAGFETLVTDTCQGKVGAIFATEASRLARNGQDWHRLLEFCALVDTLLIDHDGIYDPRHPNDRLLLGLKGTLSEMELVTFRQRSQEAIRQKARRGEFYCTIPAGYVRAPDGRLEKDPDEQVRQALSLVFAKFREYGSARQVFFWCRQEQVLLPRKQAGPQGVTLLFREATQSWIRSLLKNPLYAGAYAFGQTKRRTIIEQGRKHVVRERRATPEQWEVLIQDHHEGYLTWSDYLYNQTLLAQNCNNWGDRVQGAVRHGSAVLAGLVRCGRCGKKMRVQYHGRSTTCIYYYCSARLEGANTKQVCTILGGLTVERAATEAFLAALSPLGLRAAVHAHQLFEDQAAQVREQRLLHLERARYEAQRAERQYQSVEPENRLVARTLEQRWNQALARVTELEAALARGDSPRQPLSEAQAQELQRLATDLPRVWHHEAAPWELKKRLLRAAIKEIIVFREATTIRVLLHWQGGQHTELRLPRRKPGEHRWKTQPETTQLIGALARLMPDKQIAAQLNRLGLPSAKGHTWTRIRVGSFRKQNQIPNFQPGERQARGDLTIEEVATRLNVSYMTVLRMIQRQLLPATQVCPGAPWIIQEAALQSLSSPSGITLTHQEGPLPLFSQARSVKVQ
jgi:excisionase family DNA binding protein